MKQQRTPARIARVLLVTMAMTVGPAFGQPAPAAPYEGPKKTLSVDQFLATETTGGAVTADSMTALLTAALIRDGRFVVVERPGLAGVQAEQALAQSGAANVETAARPGQLIGASAIVRGVVTKFQPTASGGGVNMGSLNLGRFVPLPVAGVELKSQTAMMEISLRLVDTTTGQVLATSSAQGTASSSSVGLGGTNTGSGVTGGSGVFQNSPIGKAGEDAIAKAVELIAAGMRNVPWTAHVVDFSDGQVYVAAGADRNVQAGMPLTVYRKGKVLTDPTTGAVLDVEMRKLGVIRISGVRERLSTAQLESGEPPARGDVLRLE